MAWKIFLGVGAIFAIHAVVLWLLGQPIICACGYVQVWHGSVLDAGNSQHLFDWYSLSHVIHGLLFYALFTYLFPRLPLAHRLLLSVGLEAAWEIVENTPAVINYYREQALAQGYSGDSIINSLSDAVAALCGFLFASRARTLTSVIVALFLECLALYMIHDNLTLNIMQFFWQPDFLAQWQSQIQ